MNSDENPSSFESDQIMAKSNQSSLKLPESLEFKSFDKKRVALITAIVAGIILVVILLGYFHLLPFGKFKSISKSGPAKVSLTRGTVTAINGSNLTLDTGGKSQTFSIANTKDIEQITSGSLEKGDAHTSPSVISALKVGKNILAVANIGSQEANVILIVH